MRRLIAITAFALALALPLWAQHGGGHAGAAHGGGFSGHAGFGGGHGGGFSGGHVGGGHFSGGHFSGGMRSSPRASRGFSHRPSFSRPSSRRGFSNSHFRQNRFRGPRIRTFGFRNNCFGFPCRRFGFPWAFGGFYDPWWWDSDSSYDDDYERDRAIANDMNEQSLEQQRMLRQEEADGDQDAYGSGSSAPRRGSDPPANSSGPNEAQQAVAIVPPTVLVFRDQHQQEIRNYAIVGQTLWNFAPQHTEKIPLSGLDLQATTKANDERGLTFRVPAAGEAQ